MYAALTGSCAEQAANSGEAGYSLTGLTLNSTMGLGTTEKTELLLSPTTMVLGTYNGVSSADIISYAFDDTNLPDPLPSSLSSNNVQYVRGMSWGNSGGYLFWCGTSTSFRRITVSTAYDLTSGTFSGTSISGHALSSAQGVHIKDDGTKYYVVSGGVVYTYTPSSAYATSISSTTTNSFSSQLDDDGDAMGTNFTCIRFSPLGSRMFIAYRNSFGTVVDTINHPKIAEFSLSTPWDVSTATFTQSLDTAPIIGFYDSDRPTFIGGFDWNSDGTRLLVAGVHRDSFGLANTDPSWPIGETQLIMYT